MATYRYVPLTDPKHIRLLSLHSGEGDGELACDLNIVTLGDHPNLEALSYTWGDATQLLPLKCGGGTTLATVNLHSALRHLRRVDVTRTLWVDALCINQGDTQERNSQIRLMADIYSSASLTLIWLGEENSHVCNSFNSIKIARSFLPAESGGTAIISADFDRDAIQISHWKDDEADKMSLYRVDWKSIVKLLERPWFQRKWIIQEVIKSKDRLIICGAQQLPWVILSDLVLWLAVHNLTFFSNFTLPLPTLGMQNVLFTSWDANLFALWELLSQTTTFFCVDDRDNIIALLSLACDVSTEDIAYLADYSLTPVELYQRYAQWLLSSKQCINFLYCGYDPITRQALDISSWLPYIGPHHDRLQHNLPAVELSFLYNATKNMKPRAAIVDCGRLLKIWGKTVDTIERITSAYTTDHLTQSDMVENASAHAIILSAWFKECETVASAGRTSIPADKIEEFWRTLCLDRETERSRATLDFEAVMSRYLTLIQGGWRDLDVEGLKQWMTLCNRINPIIVALRGRRFCRTIGGRFGVVDAGARVGDQICMFFGGSMLFVLRSARNGAYTFVGIGYLHGFMDGEAVDRVDLEEEEFVLA